jgi:hypothetical protein
MLVSCDEHSGSRWKSFTAKFGAAIQPLDPGKPKNVVPARAPGAPGREAEGRSPALPFTD